MDIYIYIYIYIFIYTLYSKVTSTLVRAYVYTPDNALALSRDGFG